MNMIVSKLNFKKKIYRPVRRFPRNKTSEKHTKILLSTGNVYIMIGL